ncbi:type VI secretion system baseplate subunit TssK [Archangium primigenium]|uniref:type VI secretion system baseplate subunit TssK n=1 Tax=[Archangium] primigenium TaxID=2792470 RepID=UPI00195AED79|nr:type VI secretion system baseplate subunit TssK [Archangium primigenium]MBM7115297.1 type VI secretion system baseplate subunit TssK [Archangium primigenium]
MKPPQRVVWSEGMFMSPHHLQQQDLYHENVLEARLGALLPHPWGVAEQEFDMEALRAGQVQLLRFSGILPDGLPIAFMRGEDEAPPARIVEGHFPVSEHTLGVYLGIPKERNGVESYGVSGQVGASPRFTPKNRPIGDLHAATSVMPVAFAQRNLRLLFANEHRDDFDALKIAELSRDKSGNLVLVATYVPPCLRLDASPYLLNELRLLLRLIISKQRTLSSRRRHRNEAALEFTASDVTLFLELNALNGVIPFLQHALEAGNVTPRELYLALSRCAGQLCTFTPDADPSTLPSFQYTHLRTTFEALFQRLNELLRAVALEQCLSVSLELGADRIFRGALSDERLERCGQFFLTVRSELPEAQVAAQLPKLVKVACASEIRDIVHAASPGVPLKVTYRPPPEIPVQPGTSYFALAVQDTCWKSAMRERNVALYLPHPFDISRTSIELLAVPANGQ